MTSSIPLFAIYDADGSVLGELKYALGKCIGKRECALCDLSHGWNPFGRRSWRQRTGVTANLTWLHRDELPEALKFLSTEQLPCIAAEIDSRVEVLIDREALQGCDGNYSVFEHLLEQKLRALEPDYQNAAP